jgi:prepilin-type processing-associated H-X9-DG protein
LRTGPLVVVALLSLAPLASNRAEAPPAPDFSTPEATLNTFAAALTRMDFRAAAGAILGAPAGNVAKILADLPPDGQDMPIISVSEVKARITGDAAEVTFTSTIQDRSPLAEKRTAAERLLLKRTEGKWLILAGDEANARKLGDEPLTIFVHLLRYPRLLAEAREAARAVACRTNVKQLCLAVGVLAQDHDERYALRADAWKKALMPYLGKEEVFGCPQARVEGGPAVSYTFNHHLQGKPSAAVRRPNLTVMVYEGSKGKLDFRHDGKAVVGYADGSVRSVTVQEAAKLRWIP